MGSLTVSRKGGSHFRGLDLGLWMQKQQQAERRMGEGRSLSLVKGSSEQNRFEATNLDQNYIYGNGHRHCHMGKMERQWKRKNLHLTREMCLRNKGHWRAVGLELGLQGCRWLLLQERAGNRKKPLTQQSWSANLSYFLNCFLLEILNIATII